MRRFFDSFVSRKDAKCACNVRDTAAVFGASKGKARRGTIVHMHCARTQERVASFALNTPRNAQVFLKVVLLATAFGHVSVFVVYSGAADTRANRSFAQRRFFDRRGTQKLRTNVASFRHRPVTLRVEILRFL